MTSTSTTRILTLAMIAAAATVPLTGCRGDRSREAPRQFFPDLDDQAKWHPQGQSEFFSDSREMRQPPKGTVAYGRTSFAPEQTAPSATAGPGKENWGQIYAAKQADFLKEDDRIYMGTNPDGTYLDKIPVPVDAALLARGEKWFTITCANCHGYEGDGKGMVGKVWSAPLPNFHDPKYLDKTVNTGKDGYIFHTALVGFFDQTGKQKMPGYGHALDTMDAWGVVAYVRALQESKLGTINDVPEAQRAELLKRKPAPVPPPVPVPTTPPAAKPPAGGAK